jgi:8-oxo-dGTP pyrophosphatase MutT (NUDIX family)
VAVVRKALMTMFRALPTPLRRVLVRLGTPSYTVGAVLVLRRQDGRVLMVEQRHTGGWALPGGLLRRSEEPVEGLVREVSEEIGVHLDSAQLPSPTAVVDASARRVDLGFVLDADDQKPRREDEVEVLRLGWFALDELPDVTDPTRDILRSVPVA